jgi:hypothetical protein
MRVNSSVCGSILLREWLTVWLVCWLTGGDMAETICHWANLLTHFDPQSKTGCMQRVPCLFTRLSAAILRIINLIFYLLLFQGVLRRASVQARTFNNT